MIAALKSGGEMSQWRAAFLQGGAPELSKLADNFQEIQLDINLQCGAPP